MAHGMQSGVGMRCVFLPLQGTNANYSLIVIPGVAQEFEHSGISLTHLGGRGCT